MLKIIFHFCPSEKVLTSLACCFKGLGLECNWWISGAVIQSFLMDLKQMERHRECSLAWVVAKPESKSNVPKEADGCF